MLDLQIENFAVVLFFPLEEFTQCDFRFISLQIIDIAVAADGIYTGDPLKDPKAKRFTRIGYLDFLKKRLQVMDATAVSLCMENKLPVLVFVGIMVWQDNVETAGENTVT